MAIAIDHASLGHLAADTSGTTVAFTTSAAVASGGFIVLGVTWVETGGITLSSVSGGGLTWTIDLQGSVGGGGGSGVAIVSAQAPSGLASSTTITATFSASTAGGRSICGLSFTGVKTTAAVDTTNGPTVNSGTAWATGSTTITAGSVIVACSTDFSTLDTSTPTSPSVEAHDFGDGGFATTTCYRIEASAGSYTVAGTWSATASGLTNGVAYLAAAGGGTNATVTSPVAASTAAVVAPPKPRPANPFSEINVRM